MPIALVIFGVVFLVTALNGTSGKFVNLVKGDFTGPDNFLFWLVAIAFIGSVGYVDTLEPIADMFFILLVAVMLLSNKGFFPQLSAQLSQSKVAQ